MADKLNIDSLKKIRDDAINMELPDGQHMFIDNDGNRYKFTMKNGKVTKYAW